MSLTPEQIALRDGRLTASRVKALMGGDQKELLALWEEMVGIREPDDLDAVWPVRLGAVTEQLNLDWYERKEKTTVIKRGEVIFGKPDWMACTLDGWDREQGIPVEAKHVGGFETPDVVLARYQPQLHWTMIVTRANKIAFSVIYGAKEPVVEFIEYDKAYGADLIVRAEEFMKFVWSFTPPVVLPSIQPPVLAEKTVEMKDTPQANMWGEQAATWLENVDHRKKADDAEKELKGMMPADAKIAKGNGVKITRAKNGALSVRRE